MAQKKNRMSQGSSRWCTHHASQLLKCERKRKKNFRIICGTVAVIYSGVESHPSQYLKVSRLESAPWLHITHRVGHNH